MYLFNIVAASLALASASLAQNEKSCTASAVTPKPTPKYCGTKGTISSPALAASYGNVTSVKACANACVSTTVAGCASFAYAQAGGVCRLFGKSLENMGYKPNRASKDGSVKYDRKCFKATDCTCPLAASPTAPTVSGNLFTDSGFEGDNSVWSFGSTPPGTTFLDDCSTSTGFPYTGKYFAQMQLNASENTQTRLGQMIDLPGNGSTFALNLAYRVIQTPSDEFILTFASDNSNVRGLGSNGGLFLGQHTTPVGAYMNASLPFTSGNGGPFTAYLAVQLADYGTMGGLGIVDVDDVSVVRTS